MLLTVDELATLDTVAKCEAVIEQVVKSIENAEYSSIVLDKRANGMIERRANLEAAKVSGEAEIASYNGILPSLAVGSKLHIEMTDRLTLAENRLDSNAIALRKSSIAAEKLALVEKDLADTKVVELTALLNQVQSKRDSI
jgi:hypothetical protein